MYNLAINFVAWLKNILNIHLHPNSRMLKLKIRGCGCVKSDIWHIPSKYNCQEDPTKTKGERKNTLPSTVYYKLKFTRQRNNCCAYLKRIIYFFPSLLWLNFKQLWNLFDVTIISNNAFIIWLNTTLLTSMFSLSPC